MLFVCSETCCTTVQRARGRHSGNINRAAMSGKWGLSRSSVPLVSQQWRASTGSQKQRKVCQLFLQHQPRHRRPGTKMTSILLLLHLWLYHFSSYCLCKISLEARQHSVFTIIIVKWTDVNFFSLPVCSVCRQDSLVPSILCQSLSNVNVTRLI